MTARSFSLRATSKVGCLCFAAGLNTVTVNGACIGYGRRAKVRLTQDLKPNNLLIAPNGELKIADFGLARECGDPGARMTSQVVTRWYRAPELLLGTRAYSTGVDMWAVGCIFAELMLRTPYLPGESDAAQLTTIFRALGTPTQAEWPHWQSLPDYRPMETYPKQNLALLFTAASPDALDFLSQCLRYDPLARVRSTEALSHAYFTAGPLPTPPAQLPRPAAVVATESAAPASPAPPAPTMPHSTKRELTDEDIAKRKRLAHLVAFG